MFDAQYADPSLPFWRNAEVTVGMSESIERIGADTPVMARFAEVENRAAATIQRGAALVPFGVGGVAPGPQTYWTNRGRTALGVYVYWDSPGTVDTAGAYYPYISPPWTDIVEVVGVRTWEE